MVDYSSQTDTGQVLPRVYDRDANMLQVGANDDVRNVDEASSTITYVGFARPGTADITPAWRIFRIETSGTVTKIRWAEGTAAYENIWSNRASLTYS